MTLELDEERKNKIWEEIYADLNAEEIQLGEKTIRMVMKERDISYTITKKFLNRLVREGKLIFRYGKNRVKIYCPVD
jgi:predicted transcriptional regulator